MSHWAETYVGMQYSDNYDCAVMASDILAKHFGRIINLPSERDSGVRGTSKQIYSLKDEYAYPVQTPQEGDGVLMKMGRLYHVGVYCLLDNIPYVLHNMKRTGVVLHRVSALRALNTTVEGYYRWK